MSDCANEMPVATSSTDSLSHCGARQPLERRRRRRARAFAWCVVIDAHALPVNAMTTGELERADLKSGSGVKRCLASLMPRANESRMMAMMLNRTGGTLAIGDLRRLLTAQGVGYVTRFGGFQFVRLG